jgi:hypothetical protein
MLIEKSCGCGMLNFKAVEAVLYCWFPALYQATCSVSLEFVNDSVCFTSTLQKPNERWIR